MIPVSELVTLSGTNGPLVINHFNLLRSADILGGPAPGTARSQALQAMEETAAKVLPWLYLRLDDHGLSGEEGGRHHWSRLYLCGGDGVSLASRAV